MADAPEVLRAGGGRHIVVTASQSQARTMPLIFSYGSLQEEAVQLSVYGRVLHGEADAMVGWVCTLIEVPKWHKAASSGTTHYANVARSPKAESRVAGTVLDLTDAELISSDGYERDAEYVRVMITLASGRDAWVYVSARTVD
jgi:gamma-glutamylcyclotransferase (GGCT)/AIG2-like uncharacterized protein YtfP